MKRNWIKRIIVVTCFIGIGILSKESVEAYDPNYVH